MTLIIDRMSSSLSGAISKVTSIFWIHAASAANAADPLTVYKNSLRETGDTGGISTTAKNPDLSSFIGSLIGQFLGILGILLVCYFIYGGYVWMTAQGNEESVKTAKKIIRNAAIGMLLIFLSYAIINFAFTQLANVVIE